MTIEAQIRGTGPLGPGTLLQGRYRIIRLVGNGGMSRVYEARQLDVDQNVAIKEMLSPADSDLADEARRRFQKEAHTLADLNHAAIPGVTAFFSQDGRSYLVMEYVEGSTLQQLVRNAAGSLPESTVVAWTAEICDVLSYIHGQSDPLVFRDLKPSNIMLDSSGQIKLIDFGIARIFKPGKGFDTESMGTAGYSSPEQYGKGQTDARSDIYSLGACLHFLLTGRDPAESPFNFPPVRQLNPSVTSGVERIVGKCLSVDPGLRFQSARELKEALAAQTMGTTAIPPEQKPAPDAAAPCLRHLDATQLTLGSRKICRACATEARHTLRRQHVLGALAPFSLVILCLAAAAIHGGASSPAESVPFHAHGAAWWPLTFAAAYLASGAAALAAPRAVRYGVRTRDGRLPIARPFDRRHQLRDLNAIGLLFALLYSFGTALTPPARSAAGWIEWRLPLVLLAGSASLLLAVQSPLRRWITRRTFLPHSFRADRFIVPSAYIAFTLLMLPFFQWLAITATRAVPEGWLIAGAIVALISLGALALDGLRFRPHSGEAAAPADRSDDFETTFPIQAKIALIGPSNVGKTVFLTRAFYLLEQKPHGDGFRMKLEPEAPAQVAVVRRLIRRLHEDRAWPDATTQILEVPFKLTVHGDEIMRLRWQDVPGGAVTNGEEGDEENVYGSAATEYERHLAEAHAVALLVDAEELSAQRSSDEILKSRSYFDQMDRLAARLKLGSMPGGIPLAVIVTKCCRAAGSRRKMERLLYPLIQHWRGPALRSGVTPPPVRIFWSSAVVIPAHERNRVPQSPEMLRSEQCVEPVWWMAEQILRQRMGPRDLAIGLYHPSTLQDLTIQLAALAGR